MWPYKGNTGKATGIKGMFYGHASLLYRYYINNNQVFLGDGSIATIFFKYSSHSDVTWHIKGNNKFITGNNLTAMHVNMSENR